MPYTHMGNPALRESIYYSSYQASVDGAAATQQTLSSIQSCGHAEMHTSESLNAASESRTVPFR